MTKLLLFIKKIFNGEEKQLKNNTHLYSLGPKIIINEDELKITKPYLELLRDCIEDGRITNIAVTGSYGSGKSTILKTFQNWYVPFKETQEDKYLNLSLASFDKEELEGTNSEELKFERRVELSILQQMFYQVPSSELPASRFKRIKNIKSSKLYIIIAVGILWLASVSILFNLDFIKRTPAYYLIENSNNWWNLVPWLFFIVGIGLIIKKLFYLFNNSRIHKVSIKGEMELGDMGESIFNQYLEEILYFFERTKYEVVIIEDIDRFGDTQLFTKLREINVLLNNSKSISRKIKFVYAVKDDIFKDRTERTKFFDYIIPIIPFVDPHNASEQLIQLLRKSDVELSSDFIEDITSFIGDIDMRLVLNVFNEFNLYRRKISVGKLDNLFAIVFYKNLYPDDFTALHQDKGKLFDLISKKNDYHHILKRKYEKEIAEIDEKIKKINKEKRESIKELRSVYLFNLLTKLPEIYQFDMGFNNIKDAVLDENFEKISSGVAIKYLKKSCNHYQRRINEPVTSSPELFSKIEEEISETPYLIRENNIQKKIDGELEQLRKDKLAISNKVSEIEFKKFSVLFDKVGKEEDFKDYPAKEGELIRYLVLNEFIDDNYRDYMSLFFDISITRKDHEFIQDVKLAKSPSFDFTPSNPQKVLAKINKSYFTQSSALNYELVSYCLRNKSVEFEKLKLYKELLSTNDEVNIKFILGFEKNKADDIQLLISEISETKTNLWSQLLESNLPENELKKWVAYLFEYSNKVQDILDYEKIEVLEEFVSQQEVFEFARLMKSEKNFKEFLILREIKISNLDTPTEEQNTLFQSVYGNNNFVLNMNNIIKIIKFLNPEISVESLKHSNYSTLINSKLDPLLEIINKDFVAYVNRILLSKSNREEREETIIKVLNRDKLDIDIKQSFLLHQKSNIQYLAKVENLEVKQLVMNSDKLLPSWHNVFNYLDSLEEGDFEDILIDFLNKKRNYTELSIVETHVTDRKDEELKEFDRKLIKENRLNDEAYSKLLKSRHYNFDSIDLKNIDENKILILIKQNVLLFNESNYAELISLNSDLALIFLIENQKNTKDFVNEINKFDIEDDILIKIINSEDIYNSNKIEIVSNIEDDRIIANIRLAKSIFQWWVADCGISFSFNALQAFLNINAGCNKKIKMILHSIEKLSKTELKDLTKLLGEEFEKLFTPHQKPSFEKNEDTLKLIKLLKQNKLISSFSIEEETVRAYPFNK